MMNMRSNKARRIFSIVVIVILVLAMVVPMALSTMM